MKYLLDTNVVIELLRGNNKIIRNVYATGIDNCCICEMTIAELFYGAVNSKNDDNFNDMDIISSLFQVKRIYPCFREYAETRVTLREKGKPVDLMDLLIASVALHNDYILVTHNKRHFERIPGIKLEDWQ